MIVVWRHGDGNGRLEGQMGTCVCMFKSKQDQENEKACEAVCVCVRVRKGCGNDLPVSEGGAFLLAPSHSQFMNN